MPELSPENIDQIIRDIREQEITFSHLADELTDHLCCDVESEMEKGFNFSEAYRKVKLKLGARRLKEIQEETLYAIDTKYRYMKNAMKISGVIGTVLFGFAVLFKIQHWPGAGIMMTLGAFLLAFVFMPSALGVLWKETRSKGKLFLFISAFLAGMFFISGILFKVQHWPGAGSILILAMLTGILCLIPALLINRFRLPEKKNKRTVYLIGATGLVLFMAGMSGKLQHWPMAGALMVSSIIIFGIFLFWYTWITWKEEAFISSRFLFILIGSVALIIPGAMINLNLQYSYEDGFYPNQDQQQAMYDFLHANNNSIMLGNHDSADYALMEQIHSKTAGLLTLVSNIQVKMIQESEGEPNIPAVSMNQTEQTQAGTRIRYRLLLKPFHTGPVRDFLLPGCAAREELERALSEYNQFIPVNTPDEELQKYMSLLEPSTYLPEKEPDIAMSLMSGLHSLELLKNGILTAEAYILTAASRK
ncbi:MAG: hypothetical protein WAL29_09145 [Bacteroidales bacterium]